MNRIFFLAFAGFVLLGCEQEKISESKTQQVQPEDSTTKPVEIAKTPVTPLQGKALLVARQWLASEFETSNIKLSGELIDLKFNFKSDSTFDNTSDGKTESGTWAINEEGTKLILNYNTAREAKYDVKALNENSMIIAGKEHGMFRTITLVAKP